MDSPIRQVAELLRASSSILFITGAGLSADSGLPTYRGIGGLYEKKVTDEKIPIYEALSGRMFREDPSVLWRYLAQVEQPKRSAKPNRGHEVIAQFESRKERVWVLTQNVDGFHTAAGSRNVIEIHGNIHNLMCTSPLCAYSAQVQDYAALLELPPKCPECRGVIRPDVVLFGEELPERQAAVMERELEQGFEVIVSVGTSSVFPYIFEPILEAERRGIKTAEINPAETQMSPLVDIWIAERAAKALDAIWEIMRS
ncbi:MAG: NAD-dependent deacylase [Candidatus Woykebacteria bacterium]